MEERDVMLEDGWLLNWLAMAVRAEIRDDRMPELTT